jgi:hypothetical protein
MKCSSCLSIIFFTTIILTSCSNDSGKNEPAPTTTENASQVTSGNAEVKKSDIATQGLKGKVQTLSEIFYPAERSKKMSSKKIFKYDANGNLTELANYSATGKINSTLKSTYDALGKLVKEETILANGTVDVTSTIKTDAKGNKIEQEDIRPGGNILFNYKYSYKYDDKGQLIERTAYRGNGKLLFKYNFKYDDNGNKTEWTQTASDSTLIGKVVYKYDNKNNLTEETEYGKDGSVKTNYSYEYEFDRKGNWTRQKKMLNGKVVEIKDREIKYY